MLYSDEELKTRWERLSASDKREAFDVMEEKSHNPEFVQSLRKQWESGKVLSPKQIAVVLKWTK